MVVQEMWFQERKDDIEHISIYLGCIGMFEILVQVYQCRCIEWMVTGCGGASGLTKIPFIWHFLPIPNNQVDTQPLTCTTHLYCLICPQPLPNLPRPLPRLRHGLLTLKNFIFRMIYRLGMSKPGSYHGQAWRVHMPQAQPTPYVQYKGLLEHWPSGQTQCWAPIQYRVTSCLGHIRPSLASVSY